MLISTFTVSQSRKTGGRLGIRAVNFEISNDCVAVSYISDFNFGDIVAVSEIPCYFVAGQIVRGETYVA